MNTSKNKVDASPLPLRLFEAPIEQPRGRSRQRAPLRPIDHVAVTAGTNRGQTTSTVPSPPISALRAPVRISQGSLPMGGVRPPRMALVANTPTRPGEQCPLLTHGTVQDLPDGAFMPGITDVIREGLIAAAHAQSRRYAYSTIAMPLAMCRILRTEEKQNHQHRHFSALLATPPCDSLPLLTQHGGGTCFTLAENLVEVIKQEFGLNASALVTDRVPNRAAEWPLLCEKGESEFEPIVKHMNGVAHTDVVIGYMAGGEKRLLVLPTGQTGLGTVHDLSLVDYLDLGQQGQLVKNPHTIALRALWGRFRMHAHRFETGATFGLDLLREVLFVNAAARNAQNGRHQSARFERSFDFSGLHGSDVNTESWQRCALYLREVQTCLNLPEGFVEDVLFLISHRKNYLRDVVHPQARALQMCFKEYLRAVSMYAQFEALLVEYSSTELDHIHQGIKSLLGHAKAAVERQEGLQAAAYYDQAYLRISQQLVPESDITGDLRAQAQSLSGTFSGGA